MDSNKSEDQAVGAPAVNPDLGLNSNNNNQQHLVQTMNYLAQLQALGFLGYYPTPFGGMMNNWPAGLEGMSKLGDRYARDLAAAKLEKERLESLAKFGLEFAMKGLTPPAGVPEGGAVSQDLPAVMPQGGGGTGPGPAITDPEPESERDIHDTRDPVIPDLNHDDQDTAMDLSVRDSTPRHHPPATPPPPPSTNPPGAPPCPPLLTPLPPFPVFTPGPLQQPPPPPPPIVHPGTPSLYSGGPPQAPAAPVAPRTPTPPSQTLQGLDGPEEGGAAALGDERDLLERCFTPQPDSTLPDDEDTPDRKLGQDRLRHKRQALLDMTRPLKQWLYGHRDNPYPTKSEKVHLARDSQMTLTQVSNWFANARRRLKNTVRGPDMSWAQRIKQYNHCVEGNQELLSVSSEDDMDTTDCSTPAPPTDNTDTTDRLSSVESGSEPNVALGVSTPMTPAGVCGAGGPRVGTPDSSAPQEEEATGAAATHSRLHPPPPAVTSPEHPRPEPLHPAHHPHPHPMHGLGTPPPPFTGASNSAPSASTSSDSVCPSPTPPTPPTPPQQPDQQPPHPHPHLHPYQQQQQQHLHNHAHHHLQQQQAGGGDVSTESGDVSTESGDAYSSESAPSKYKQSILHRYLNDSFQYQHSASTKSHSASTKSHSDGTKSHSDSSSRHRNTSGSLCSHDEELSTSSRSTPTREHQMMEDHVDEYEEFSRHWPDIRNRAEGDLYWKEISAALGLTTMARSRQTNNVAH